MLTSEKETADYYEAVIDAASGVSPKLIANWVSGELFGLMKQEGVSIETLSITPDNLAELLLMVSNGEINQNTGKSVLAEMLSDGKPATQIVEEKGLKQVSDEGAISEMVKKVLDENPDQVEKYREGKESVANWLFGQVMREAKGKANPQVVRAELDKQLKA